MMGMCGEQVEGMNVRGQEGGENKASWRTDRKLEGGEDGKINTKMGGMEAGVKG